MFLFQVFMCVCVVCFLWVCPCVCSIFQSFCISFLCDFCMSFFRLFCVHCFYGFSVLFFVFCVFLCVCWFSVAFLVLSTAVLWFVYGVSVFHTRAPVFRVSPTVFL